MSGTTQPLAHSARILVARRHHVITGRHVALMPVIAACLDVTPDAFEVASCQVGGRPGPTGRLGGNGKGLVWASTYQPTPGCMTTRHILVLREAHIHPWHSPRGTTFLGRWSLRACRLRRCSEPPSASGSVPCLCVTRPECEVTSGCDGSLMLGFQGTPVAKRVVLRNGVGDDECVRYAVYRSDGT